MIACQYRWLHLPTGKSGMHVQRFLSRAEFFVAVCRWNRQQPETWAYAPLASWNARGAS